jgi:O-antigen ligase
MIFSPAVLFDLGYSLHHSAPNAVEFCGSYFAARVLLSERGQASRLTDLICHVIAIVASCGALDVLTGRPIIHDFVRQLMRLPTLVAGGGVVEYRLGILRAMGPIDHPILFGIVCTIGLLLAVGTRIRAKGVTIAACILGVILSMSSAPLLGTVLGLGLLAYDRILTEFRSRWVLLIAIGASAVASSFLFMDSPLAFFLSHVDIDKTSYWVRLLQWDTAGEAILNSPWFGVAFQWPEMAARMPFWVSTSVDSLWLYLALVYGIPGAALLGLSMLTAACSSSGRGVNLTTEESRLATTLSVLIVVIILLGFTVDLWEASFILIALLTGMRAHFADWKSQPYSTVAKFNPTARQFSSVLIS